MKIHVTKEHIEDGKKSHCRKCPIALALINAGFKRLSVMDTTVKLDGFRYDLPTIATMFIRRFDRGEKVSPFSFELDAVPA